MDDAPVYEDLRIEGSIGVPCPSSFEGECRQMTVGDGQRSIEIDVRVTPQAVVKLGGRDFDDWIEERIAGVIGSLPNDGHKLDKLAALSPLEYGSDWIVD